MNKYLVTALVSALVGAGIGYYAAHKVREASIRDLEAQMAEKQALVDSLKVKSVEDSIHIAEHDSVLAEVRDSATKAIKYWQDKADEAVGGADDAAGEADTTATELVDLLDEHEYALFQKYVSLRDMESQLLRFAIFAKDSVIFEQRREITAQQDLIDAYAGSDVNLRQIIREQDELIEFWRESSKRDWWEMPKFTVPATIATTLGGVYLIGKATEKI